MVYFQVTGGFPIDFMVPIYNGYSMSGWFVGTTTAMDQPIRHIHRDTVHQRSVARRLRFVDALLEVHVPTQQLHRDALYVCVKSSTKPCCMVSWVNINHQFYGG